MERDLERGDWLRAGRLGLLRAGVEAVRVEKLARSLGVTKGSFYWHFKDRDELLELLLREWESEAQEILSRLGHGSRRERVRRLVLLLEQRAKLSEEGKVPSDAAIFAWASVDRKVARRVNKAEEERIALLKHLIGDHDRTELFYLVWLGFAARGQRVPESRKRFHKIARLLLEWLSEPRAIAEYRAALRIRPDYTDAHFNLGDALAPLPGRSAEAIAEYRAAIRIRPDFGSLARERIRMMGASRPPAKK